MEGDRVEIAKFKKWGCTPKKTSEEGRKRARERGKGVKKMAP